MTTRARGTFAVELSPRATHDQAEGGLLGRMSIDKQFHGDLEASGKRELLSAGTDVKGSAGYVAIERVTGTLQGRSVTFVLQHSGTPMRGVPQLSITVVPHSGTDGLTGLAGRMMLDIADGNHSYDLEYTIAEAP